MARHGIDRKGSHGMKGGEYGWILFHSSEEHTLDERSTADTAGLMKKGIDHRTG
jgi:hypothetical protein